MLSKSLVYGRALSRDMLESSSFLPLNFLPVLVSSSVLYVLVASPPILFNFILVDLCLLGLTCM